MPAVREDVLFRSLDEEWVVYDPRGQNLHVLNRTAAVVWLHCTGDQTIQEIVNDVHDAFDDPPPLEQVESDVFEAIQEFERQGLLV